MKLAPTFPIHWSMTPGDGGTAVGVNPCQLIVMLPGPDGLDARDQLWATWTTWLSSQGFAASNHDQHMPWNEVRWRQFTRGDLMVELQVRRPWGKSGNWWVLLSPGSSGRA